MSVGIAGVLALSFLLGSVLGGQWLARLRRVDLRAAGSGNLGATNALRVGGKGLGAAVLLFDAAKGAAAVLLVPKLLTVIPAWLPWMSGAMAVLGHCFSPFAGFKGGKGVATLAGVFLALMPTLFAAMLAAFVLALGCCGIVSVATLAAAVTSLAGAVWVLPQQGAWPLAFCALMVLLVLYTHRDNWRRVRRGTEPQFVRAAFIANALWRRPTR